MLGRRRGILVVARKGGDPGRPVPGRERISADAAAALMPLLRPETLSHAWLETEARDIDVHAMHMAYARTLKANAGTLLTDFDVRSAEWQGGLWHVSDGARSVSAPIVINAAGAWADAVATLFGAGPKGIQPLRRSAALIDPPASSNFEDWPMVVDVEESVYFKPEAGKLMVSPADQTLSPPCDSWAEDMDIAVAIDRYQSLTGDEVRRVTHTWAGLRSFVSDASPLIGMDTSVPGFFWLAALGGYGVQTAPVTGAIAAALASATALPEGVTPELLRAIDPMRIA
jgi:D-arginine dehydrogenase